MLVGRVTGMVVSSNKVESLKGASLLIVQPVHLDTLEMSQDYVVCVDDIGAGLGDLVFCAYGSSSRQTPGSEKFASDYTIFGIIDHITSRGKRVYDKQKEEG